MTFKLFVFLCLLSYVQSSVINNSVNQISVFDDNYEISSEEYTNSLNITKEDNTLKVFDGVYTECFLRLSYACLQKKTLLYLKELDKLKEVSVIGDYVKFVKINDTEIEVSSPDSPSDSELLSTKIDEAVDKFFTNHILKFRAMGRDLDVPNSVDEFVGRKRKGGGGGGGGGGGHGHGGDDGGKKKMMMMAMMCMKMKFMMMVPAMLGMMGMMSFKGMMFSMMSFMMSKMMLLMKILEKKGGMGGGGMAGWNDGGGGGWAAGGGGGGGGGAWMPAGGQDYGGGGGGGGYDANGQWQSRSIVDHPAKDPIFRPESDDAKTLYESNFEPEIYGIPNSFTAKDAVQEEEELELNKPIITYVKPKVNYNNNKINGKKPFSIIKKIRDEVIKLKHLEKDEVKSRKKRGIVDILQNAYLYWINKILNLNSYNKLNPIRYPKYKVVNGIKYVYFPIRQVQNLKAPKDLKPTPLLINYNSNPNIINTEQDHFKPIVTAEEFNKGEIVEGAVESRMTKKLQDFKDTVDEAMEENPWQ